MLCRLILAACASLPLMTAEQPRGLTPAGQASGPPWSLSFVTQVRGADRQFVEHAGRTYILCTADELSSGAFDGQDIALTCKLRKLPGNRLGIYRTDNLILTGSGESLAGKLDGDNVHLLGSLGDKAAERSLLVRLAAPAASDAQLIQARLAGIPDDDWDRRLGVVSWCQDQARTAGNADFWNVTADSLLARIIADLGTRAAERKDLAMVVRGLDLALNQLRDPGMAARITSPIWIREHGGPAAENIARRMRGLGFSLYKDQWHPRPLALEREFEDRFAAMGWKDAEGFYRLGRWADDNAEALAKARERSWRCYQAGRQADPSHPGIARELGVQPRQGGGTTAGAPSAVGGGNASDLIDLESGIRVPAPLGWKRGADNGNVVTWTDPGSETAYITVRALPTPLDEEAQWNLLEQESRARTGFVELANEQQEADGRTQRILRYSWVEGEQQRFAMIALVALGAQRPGAVIEARGLPAEQPTLETALGSCVSGTRQQDSAPPQQ